MRRLLALAVLATLAAPGAAAAACPRATLAGLENEVMCLVCGVPLALAEAPQADRERAFIRREIDRCRTEDQIKADLVAQYGPRVLALPDTHGFPVAVYVVPPLAALLVLVGLTALIRRRRGDDVPAPPRPAPTARDAARLEAELERYR
jgi:cytochrome c-type biogenesis protein CcmH